MAFAIRSDVVLSRQIRQDIRPQRLLLPQGIEAAVQIHFVDRSKNGAAQQQTLEQMLADRKLSDIERIAILATLKKNDGQKKRTADKLGITDRTLRNKLAEYQMDL